MFVLTIYSVFRFTIFGFILNVFPIISFFTAFRCEHNCDLGYILSRLLSSSTNNSSSTPSIPCSKFEKKTLTDDFTLRRMLHADE